MIAYRKYNAKFKSKELQYCISKYVLKIWTITEFKEIIHYKKFNLE